MEDSRFKVQNSKKKIKDEKKNEHRRGAKDAEKLSWKKTPQPFGHPP